MRCIICGGPGVTRWVVDNGAQAGVGWVCIDHNGPLDDLLEAAGSTPPPAIEGLPGERPAPLTISRGRRKVTPLEWTPPAK